MSAPATTPSAVSRHGLLTVVTVLALCVTIGALFLGRDGRARPARMVQAPAPEVFPSGNRVDVLIRHDPTLQRRSLTTTATTHSGYLVERSYRDEADYRQAIALVYRELSLGPAADAGE